MEISENLLDTRGVANMLTSDKKYTKHRLSLVRVYLAYVILDSEIV